ncbi:MAG: T9SS type A sorting domain-containing protein, partial [Bacteroidota bacterium]
FNLDGPDYQYTFQINNGPVSAPIYLNNTNQFTINNVGPFDRVLVNINQFIYARFQGETFSRVFGPADPFTIDVPNVVCRDEDSRSNFPSFITSGLTNVEWNFSASYLNSSAYTISRDGVLFFRNFPPIGNYTIEITGFSQNCGEPVRFVIPFEVDDCYKSNFGSHPQTNHKEGIASDHQTANKHLDNKSDITNTNSQNTYLVFPTLAARGQAIKIRRNEPNAKEVGVKVEVIDITGKQLFTTILPASTYEISLPTQELAAGMYLLKLATGKKAIPEIHRIVVR